MKNEIAATKNSRHMYSIWNPTASDGTGFDSLPILLQPVEKQLTMPWGDGFQPTETIFCYQYNQSWANVREPVQWLKLQHEPPVRAVDPGSHPLSLLDPDPGEKNLK